MGPAPTRKEMDKNNCACHSWHSNMMRGGSLERGRYLIFINERKNREK